MTGAAGFLGGHIIPALIKLGHSIVAQDVVVPELAFRLESCLKDIEYRWESTIDTTEASVKGNDFILHFASQGDVPLANSSPRYTFLSNVEAMMSLLISARHSKVPMILMSTENVYGSLPTRSLPARENEQTNPTNSYSASKVAMEALCHAYSRQYGIPIGIIRSSTLFGEKSRPRQVVPIFIRRALAGVPITIEGNGAQTRDFNYVANTVDAIIQAMDKVENEPAYQVWNIGSGKETSVRELVGLIVRGCKSSSKILNSSPRLGEEGRLYMSIEKARRALGYEPKISLEDGLARTISSIRAEEGTN